MALIQIFEDKIIHELWMVAGAKIIIMPFSTVPGLLRQAHKPPILHEEEEDSALLVGQPVQHGALDRWNLTKSKSTE